jgi:hypothetical protein
VRIGVIAMNKTGKNSSPHVAAIVGGEGSQNINKIKDMVCSIVICILEKNKLGRRVRSGRGLCMCEWVSECNF